jgi:hypothetical protein
MKNELFLGKDKLKAKAHRQEVERNYQKLLEDKKRSDWLEFNKNSSQALNETLKWIVTCLKDSLDPSLEYLTTQQKKEIKLLQKSNWFKIRAFQPVGYISGGVIITMNPNIIRYFCSLNLSIPQNFSVKLLLNESKGSDYSLFSQGVYSYTKILFEHMPFLKQIFSLMNSKLLEDVERNFQKSTLKVPEFKEDRTYDSRNCLQKLFDSIPV